MDRTYTPFAGDPDARRIVCAAMRMEDGMIITGTRHLSLDMRSTLWAIYGERAHRKVVEQGFIDQFSAFHTREEAWNIAKKQSQIRVDVSIPGTLYSENLY